MGNIGIRDLRNHTADIVRRVQQGEVMTVTSRGVPVATLHPPHDGTRRPIGAAELSRRLGRIQADAGLRDDLRALGGDTDELGPIG